MQARSICAALLVLAAACDAFDYSGNFSGHYPAKTCLDLVSLVSVGATQFNATKATHRCTIASLHRCTVLHHCIAALF
jgi:hypothetical protein